MRIQSLLLVLVFSFGTHAKADFLINFDSFPDGSSVPDGTIIDDQYQSIGATFTGGSELIATDEFSDFYGPLAMGNILQFGPGAKGSFVRIDFANPISEVGADIIFRDTGEVTSLEVFDADAVSLGFIETAPDMGDGDEVFLGISAKAIRSAVFTFDADDSIVGIDNLQFDTNVIPEPASSVTALCLALGIVARRRRK